MSAIIDESLSRSFDPLALLRPISGPDGVAGLPPGSEGAPRVGGSNAFIWLSSTREKALLVEEVDAGLRGENERPSDAEPPTWLWERIFNVTHHYLREYGKDIRIALYCLEAWIRRDGLAGLSAGLELLRGLVAAYWETLHPLPSSGSGEDRRLDCLVEYYASRDDVALNYSPLFFALNHYVPVAISGKNILHLHATIAEGVAHLDPGMISDNVRNAAATTPPEIAALWLSACRRALENCAALEKLAVSPEFSKDEIPFPAPVKLSRRLEEIESLLIALYPHEGRRVLRPEREGERARPEESVAGIDFPDMDRIAVQIATNRRADNLRILQVLGRRFQDSEPHSPVGYALSHWADMAELPLPKLLDAMGFIENSERMGLQVFAGVRAPDKQ